MGLGEMAMLSQRDGVKKRWRATRQKSAGLYSHPRIEVYGAIKRKQGVAGEKVWYLKRDRNC